MPLASSSKRREPFRAAVLLILIGTLAAILGAKWSMIHRFGSDIPYMDQWDAEAGAMVLAHAEGKPAAECILAFHNQHRPVLTKALNYGLLQLDGQWSPLLQMTVNALVHVAAIGIFLSFAKRAFSTTAFVLTCLFGLLLFCPGYAWENTLQGFQSQFYFLLGSAFLSLWITLGSPLFSARWWLGASVGLFGLGSMGSGILTFVALGAVLCFQGLIEKTWSLRQSLALALLAALTLGGVFLGADFSIYNSQKATSLSELVAAFLSCLAWPGKPGVAFAVLMPLPALFLLWSVLRQRKLDKTDAIILGLNAWCWLQMLALAITRGHGNPGCSSRYMDVFAIALLANAFALLRLRKGINPPLRFLLICLWGGFVVTKLAVLWVDSETMLRTSFSDARKDERTVCADNARSDDPDFFKHQDATKLPYPFAGRLALLASHPAIRSVLPPSMRKPLRLVPDTGCSGFRQERLVTPPGTQPETVWVSSADQASFESRPLESRFSVFRLQFKGSPTLHGPFLALRAEDGSESAVEVRAVAGDRWQTVHLSAPAGVSKVRLIARIGGQGQVLSFTEPIEIGRYASYARWLCKRGQGLFYAGLFVSAAGLLWSIVEFQRTDKRHNAVA